MSDSACDGVGAISLLSVVVHSAGNKLNNLDVVYTPWYNLRKTPSMDVGQVGFHNSKLVRVSGSISLFQEMFLFPLLMLYISCVRIVLI